jgi:hypothetical protein
LLYSINTASDHIKNFLWAQAMFFTICFHEEISPAYNLHLNAFAKRVSFFLP